MRESGQGYRVVSPLIDTDRVMKDSFWVGVYPGLDDQKIDTMIRIIRKALLM